MPKPSKPRLPALALCLAAGLLAGCGSQLKQTRQAEPIAAATPAPRAPHAPAATSAPAVTLTSTMGQVRLMAEVSDAFNRDDLAAAYRLIQKLDPASPPLRPHAERLAAMRQELVARWSERLFTRARAEADRGRFAAAAAALEEVPAESARAEEAVRLVEELRQREEAFLRERDAAQERQDRQGRELLARALQMGAQLRFGAAVALLRQVPAGSGSREAARAKIDQYEALLRLRGERPPVARRRPPPRPRPTPARPPAAPPQRKRPVNWEQWRFQQWLQRHKQYRPPAVLPRPSPMLRPLPLWPVLPAR